MELSIARRISEGVGSYLHYLFCCNKAGLFNEDILKFSVGDVLSTVLTDVTGARVFSGYNHPALNPVKKIGAPRRVDFALINHHNKTHIDNNVFVETKWVSSTHCNPIEIMADFYRLSLIKKHNNNSSCIFLLAGPSKDIEKTLKSFPFSFPDGRTIFSENTHEKKFKPDISKHLHIKAFKETIMAVQEKIGVPLPSSFTTVSTGTYPIQPPRKTLRFQSIAWEIKHVEMMHDLLDRWYI
ncbi:hypothetical protein [Pantoea anthophila]|uniref:hypothetical protein n=1 Tax=Pantoea anthophila TaxID=470931 RepID=UPI00301B8079